MIIHEAEDFEIKYGLQNLGRFIVQSVEPYQVDLKTEFEAAGYDIYKMVYDLLERGIIDYYNPNYNVVVSLFDDAVAITKND
jgi:hypothetical protein